MTLYELKDIKKSYNGRIVLNLPELIVDAKKIYSLSGPNGAGKTTLLNILSFLAAPSSGIISFADQIVRFEEKYLHQFRKKVVLVNQQPIMFSASVYKNIEFGLKVRKISKAIRKSIIEKAVELVGMQKFIHADARFLSGGETRRIAIARALACQPDVMLLDEPTADLDPESQITIERIIENIHQQSNISIIFCTHNLAQAERLTKNKIYLLNGRVCDVIHENIFSGNVMIENNRAYCHITENVRVPVKNSANNSIKISIHPKSIEIIEPQRIEDKMDTYTGKVLQLSDADEIVRISVNIGIPLSLILKKKEYMAHPYLVGDTITIRFDKSGAVILKD